MGRSVASEMSYLWIRQSSNKGKRIAKDCLSPIPPSPPPHITFPLELSRIAMKFIFPQSRNLVYSLVEKRVI